MVDHVIHASPMAAPIYKVGLVVLRTRDGEPEVCLTQVKAKNPDEQHLVNFGLTKGTRRYFDPATQLWEDARNAATAYTHRHQLEPLKATLLHEAEEELGIAPIALEYGATIYDLGVQKITSRKHGNEVQDVAWYVIDADRSLQDSMDPAPKDAHAVKWVKLSQLQAMGDDDINQDYVKITVDAIEKLKAQQLTPAVFHSPMPQPK